MNRVRFVYWWDNCGEAGEPVAFYRVEDGPNSGSDITAETVHQMGLPIPLTPTFQTWKNLKGAQNANN